VIDKWPYIFGPGPERWDFHPDDIESVIEIATEYPILYSLCERAIGGCDES